MVPISLSLTETRLGKLQGSNKQKLTSKEIISSITEARGDHMRQYMTTEATNDPWCSSPTAIRNEYAEMGFEEPQHHKPLSRTNHWGSYLCCCQGSKPAYSRVGVREQRGEEVACLVECDELDLTWQNRNSITWPSHFDHIKATDSFSLLVCRVFLYCSMKFQLKFQSRKLLIINDDDCAALKLELHYSNQLCWMFPHMEQKSKLTCQPLHQYFKIIMK